MEDEFVLVTQEDLDLSTSRDELDGNLADVHAETAPLPELHSEQAVASERSESAVLPPAGADCPPDTVEVWPSVI